MVDGFVPSGFVPYFPELVYVHSAFAAVVLLKVRLVSSLFDWPVSESAAVLRQCLRPEYSPFLDLQQEERIVELVQRLFETWTSDKFALDERHNTQLYARFVKQLMEPHLTRLAERKRAAAAGAASGHSQAGLTEIKTEQVPISPTSISDAATSPTVYHEQDPTLNLGEIYSPDVDVSKAAAQLSAAGMLPDPSISWEQLFASSDSGGFLNGPMGGGDVTGMMGDECLAAMMGLGDGAWFLQN